MDFARKYRLADDCRKTPDPFLNTYASVVSCETVQIAFVYTAIQVLDVKATDINDAYLQAPVEGYYTRLADEF